MEKITLKGRGVTSGAAEGEALVTKEAFGFCHGLEPTTGLVSDEKHEWLGQSVKGKVMVYSRGKGSTGGGLYILEAVRLGNAPSAIINLETDPVIAGGFIMAKLLYDKEIPVIDSLEQDPVDIIRTGDRVKVDANNGIIEIYRLNS
ncbi:aconitase X swivel domain-containing protein [Chloroflexota bacterium]